MYKIELTKKPALNPSVVHTHNQEATDDIPDPRFNEIDVYL